MKTIAITSGKGGVGKSNTAVNVGLALVQVSRRVLLFDADLGLANLDILLGCKCTHTLADVVEGRRSLDEVIVEAAPNLRVLPASSGILEMERLSYSRRVKLLTELDALAAEYDYLLIDTGAGVSENVLFFCAGAGGVVVVTTPEPTAMMDSYAMIKVLLMQHDVRSFNVVVNQVRHPGQGLSVFAKLNNICQKFLHQDVHYMGELPHDSALERSVIERKPVLLSNPGSSVSRAVVTLSQEFERTFASGAKSRASAMWEAIKHNRDSLPPEEV